MTQFEKVKKAIQDGNKTISEIHSHTHILEPNIRRILGQGALKGEFKRIRRGIYTLTTESGEERAYIQMGKAQDVLPQMASQGKKFDMVFLDPAYFSRTLIGGNRGIKKFDFLYPEEFATVMNAVNQMMRTPDSHVYLMLSGAPTAQRDMHQYLFAALENGFEYVAEGKYSKFFQNGKPVTNVRGNVASSERLILLTQSGKYRTGELPDLQLDFNVMRPSIKHGYPTEKAEPMVDQVILQSTHQQESVLDPSAGSGIVGERSFLHNRYVHMVEVLESAIENFIMPRFKKFSL